MRKSAAPQVLLSVFICVYLWLISSAVAAPAVITRDGVGYPKPADMAPFPALAPKVARIDFAKLQKVGRTLDQLRVDGLRVRPWKATTHLNRITVENVWVDGVCDAKGIYISSTDGSTAIWNPAERGQNPTAREILVRNAVVTRTTYTTAGPKHGVHGDAILIEGSAEPKVATRLTMEDVLIAHTTPGELAIQTLLIHGRFAEVVLRRVETIDVQWPIHIGDGVERVVLEDIPGPVLIDSGGPIVVDLRGSTRREQVTVQPRDFGGGKRVPTVATFVTAAQPEPVPVPDDRVLNLERVIAALEKDLAAARTAREELQAMLERAKAELSGWESWYQSRKK